MPSTRRTRSSAPTPATPAAATPAVPPTAPAPAAAPAPPTPQPPPDLPPPQPDRGTATFVPRSAQRDHLSCYAVAALGAPRKLELTRVFTPDGLSCAVGSRTRLFIRLTNLVQRLPEVPGASSWEDIGEAAEVLANARTGVGSVNFRQELAKINLVEHVITLLLHHGLLLRSTHCVLLHGALETDQRDPTSSGRSGGGGGSGGGKGKAPATSGPGNSSAGTPAAIDLAGAAPADGGSGSGTGGAAGTADMDADLSEHDKAFVHLVSQQQHGSEMAWHVMFIARVLRNSPPEYSWLDLHAAITRARDHAANVGLDQEHHVLKIALIRGEAMAAGGSSDAFVHNVFSQLMPSVNGVSQTQFIRDQKALARVRKAHGGSSGGPASMVTAPAQHSAAINMMPAGFPGMQPFFGGAAAPAHNPFAYGITPSGAVPVTLPLGSGRVGGGTAPSAKTRKSSKKRQPLSLSTHELAAIDMANKAMQSSQQQYGPVPNGPVCNTCAAAKRNPNHHHQSCAFFICHHCKRAGHRISKCPF